MASPPPTARCCRCSGGDTPNRLLPGFAVYLATQDGYEDSVLPSGYPAGTPEEALDCACGLYLNDATAWLNPPTN
jgi:hypothetical protein